MRELKTMLDEIIINPKVLTFVFAFLNLFNWANFDVIITRLIAVLSIVAIISSIRLSQKRASQIDKDSSEGK